MQQLTVSSQHDNLDDSPRAELPEINSISVDHHLEGENPTSNGLASPGLQSGPYSEEKERSKLRDSTEKEMGSPSLTKDNDGVAHQAPERKKRNPWLFFIIGAIACLIIGLTVGLGVGLTRKRSTKSGKYTPTTVPTTTTLPPTQPSSSGTSPTPNYLSTVGAFNGTGIALASKSYSLSGLSYLENSGYDAFMSIFMYFQHNTGEIREMQLGENQYGENEWVGGNSSDLVVRAGDVKIGTPITAVSYEFNNSAAWHIFYISANNTIQEIRNSNTTNNWAQGPINNLNLNAMNDSLVGLQACWNGSFYGPHTSGIGLWYAKDSTTFGFVSWAVGDKTWTEENDLIDYNGYGGVGCYSGLGLTYVMVVNLQNELNILETNMSTMDGWNKTNVSIPVFQNTSIAYADYLYVQNSDLSISGWNVDFVTGNVTTGNDNHFNIQGANGISVPYKGIPGTHLTCYTDILGTYEVFYQTNGTNIEQFESDLQNPWSMVAVPIPAS